MYSALTASDEICMQRAQPRGVPCLQDRRSVGLSWESHDERENLKRSDVLQSQNWQAEVWYARKGATMERSSPSFRHGSSKSPVPVPVPVIQIQTIPGSVAPSVSQTRGTRGTGTVGQGHARQIVGRGEGRNRPDCITGRFGALELDVRGSAGSDETDWL